MTWIDYKNDLWYDPKNFDKSQKMYKIWQSNELYLKNNGKIERGISNRRTHQNRDNNPKKNLPGRFSLMPLLFGIALMPLKYVLRNCIRNYTFTKLKEKIYHLMTKVFAKYDKELEILIQILRIYSHDLGMKFSIEKTCHANNESGKRESTKGIELVNNGSEHHQTSGYEGKKMRKEYLRRMRKLLEIKPYNRNLIQAINIWTVLLVRYSSREEQMDQKHKKRDDYAQGVTSKRWHR